MLSNIDKPVHKNLTHPYIDLCVSQQWIALNDRTEVWLGLAYFYFCFEISDFVEERMFHSLTGRGSSVRIQIEQPLQQVQAVCPEHLIEFHQFLNAFDSIAIYSCFGHHFEVPLHRNHLHEVDSLPLGHRSSLALRLSVLQDLNRLWIIRASQ